LSVSDEVHLKDHQGTLQVSCEKAVSGYMPIAFCKFCQNNCKLAGKNPKEIRAKLRQQALKGKNHGPL
jgi:hypothetical protein